MRPRIGPVLVVALCAAGVVVPALPAWACQEAYFSPASYAVSEKDGAVVVTVENPGTLPRTRTVGYQTIAGTAKAGNDFVAESGTLSFSPTVATRTFDIALVNDAVNEGLQRFEVKLKTQDGSCIETLGPQAVVTIADDDPNATPSPVRDGSDPPKPPPDTPNTDTGSDGGSTGSTDTEGSPTTEPADAVAPTFSPSPTAGTPTPVETRTVFAAIPTRGGGPSGLMIFGMVAGALVVGSVAAVLAVREKDPATQPQS